MVQIHPRQQYLYEDFRYHNFNFDSILPSREARQFFHEDIYSLKYPIMQKKSFIEDEEVKMIFRQIGFGAALGTDEITLAALQMDILQPDVAVDAIVAGEHARQGII